MGTAVPTTKPKDRIDLRLYNTIVIYDDYVVARSNEEARQALLASIQSGDTAPTEVVAKEVSMISSVRASKVDERPLIASDVTDDEFEKLRGITNGSAFEPFYLKR